MTDQQKIRILDAKQQIRKLLDKATHTVKDEEFVPLCEELINAIEEPEDE